MQRPPGLARLDAVFDLCGMGENGFGTYSTVYSPFISH